jgi:leader peptidase (prepilin peptidase)/N-methyltransferase
VTALPIVLGCAALGAAIGMATVPVTRWFLPDRDRHPLASVPALASATAIVFGLVAWRIGLHPVLAAYACLAAASIPLAAIDLIDHRLPSALLLPLYPVLAGLFGLAALLAHNDAPLLRALLGMAALFAFYLVVALLGRGRLGAGDVRLGGVLGMALAWRGWTTLAAGTVLGLLYAALAGAILIILRRASRHTLLPFGPALIAGALTALLLPLG